MRDVALEARLGETGAPRANVRIWKLKMNMPGTRPGMSGSDAWRKII